MSNKPHNLDIHMYSFEEILGLFQLSPKYDLEELKRAKKQVLMTHPDKSRLPPEYFLFYKKAFEIVVDFYQSQTKQTQVITEDTTNYAPLSTSEWSKETESKISNTISKMPVKTFQENFNRLFEENMSKETRNVNEWFSKNDPLFQIDPAAGKNIESAINTVKGQARASGLIVYRGVSELSSDMGGGNRLYDDDGDEYVTSNPFSKLKYDDLRKVHKDQTVLAVSEADYASVQKYRSVEHLNRVRGVNIEPVNEATARMQLEAKEQMVKEAIMKKEYMAKLESMKYEEKNKSILSRFLQLN
jgi:hypothetical protein